MAPRLLLINPAMRADGSTGAFQDTLTTGGRRRSNAGGMATMEPLGLAYVAALTPPHWQVRLVDEVLEDIPGDAWDRPDLVGLTSLSITDPAP